MRHVRVLQIHTRYRSGRGGEDTVVDSEWAVLRHGGHTVRRWETSNAASTLRTAARLTVAFWNPMAARTLRAVITEFQPDVAHVHNTWFSASASVTRVLRQEGVPTVMTLHNYRLTCANALLYRDQGYCQSCVVGSAWNSVRFGCTEGPRLTAVPAALSIAVHRSFDTWNRNVDLFLAPSMFVAEIMGKAGIEEGKLLVKPHFLSRIPGRRAAPPSNSRELLFVGRLAEPKGIDLVLDAWKRAKPSGLRLAIIGDGPSRPLVEATAREDSSVEYFGWLDSTAVLRKMGSARSLLFASRGPETFGLVLIEALGSGLPVAGARVAIVPELARHLPTMPTFVPGDRDALIRAIETLNDDALVDALGAKGLSLFSEESEALAR